MIFSTPVGRVIITANETHLCGVELLIADEDRGDELASSIITQLAVEQLNAYFLDAHDDWSLPLAEQGTVFQRRVWHYLRTIPLGETRHYSAIAKALDTSARAVGNACRANPFAIVIPCHRVVSKSGIGGYYGSTEGNEISVKQWLLDHEC